MCIVLKWMWMKMADKNPIPKKEQRYRFVYCFKCLSDIEEEEGYLGAKHFDFCPYCGNELIRVPNRVMKEMYGKNKK